MTIAYVAETQDHTLMLDDEGVCLYVHCRQSGLRGPDASVAACVGAQYVAALDPSTPGFLLHEPTVGVPMLFAKASSTGRIRVIRTGPLLRFEAQASGLHERTVSIRDNDIVASEPANDPFEVSDVTYLAHECVVEDEPTMAFRIQRRAEAKTKVQAPRSRAF